MSVWGPFVDLQANGYAGLDFNADEIAMKEVLRVNEVLRNDGVVEVMVTLITAPIDDMVRRIRRWSEILNQLESMANETAPSAFAGIHIEGPFISAVDGYVGAHPAHAVMAAEIEIASRLIDAGQGWVRMVTLAPEQDDGGKVTRWLSDQGIVVAAGHSDASIDQLKLAIDHGLRLYTHLGNGCPSHLARHDSIIQRVLYLSDRLMISFIADGHHVPLFALSNYLKCVPSTNVIIVTDAISAAGLGPGKFPLGDQFVEVGEDGAAWSADRKHFAGSAATMPSMARRLREHSMATEQELRRWMNENPAKLIR